MLFSRRPIDAALAAGEPVVVDRGIDEGWGAVDGLAGGLAGPRAASAGFPPADGVVDVGDGREVRVRPEAVDHVRFDRRAGAGAFLEGGDHFALPDGVALQSEVLVGPEYLQIRGLAAA